MRTLGARLRNSHLAAEDGWVMMDAVWSAVVVIMAFMATFLALDSAGKTAVRDVRVSSAYELTQNELDGMRALGARDINALLALDNTTKSVAFDGNTYSVAYDAYYVTGLGDNLNDACGAPFATSGSGAARYIYIKTTVTYKTANNNTDARPVSLDQYFAPEASSAQTATGTLRIYVLDRNAVPYTSQTVSLYNPSVSSSAQQSKSTNSFGCVLFTGLDRGSYEVRIPQSKYDIYMTTNPVTVPFTIPARAALSRDVRIESPATVIPTFVSNTGASTADFNVNLSATSALTQAGPWVAESSKILYGSGTDISPGRSFMPHVNTSITNLMYPDPAGYSTFSGPCNINGTSQTRVNIPATGNNTWGPNQTYTPFQLRLVQLRQRVFVTPTNGLGLTRNEAMTLGTGRVVVRLRSAVGAVAGSLTPDCGARDNLYNTWIRLPGGTGSTGFLTDDNAEVIPPGRYDICVRGTVTWQSRTSTGSSTWTNQSQVRYANSDQADIAAPNGAGNSLDLWNFTSTPPSGCPSTTDSIWT